MLEHTTTEIVDTGSGVHPRSTPRLWLGAGQRLWLEHAGKTACVRPVRCFPWSAPGEQVSLRDKDEQEHYFVSSPEELDVASRAALTSAMASAGFVLEVDEVRSVEEDYEVRVWRVHTRQGARTFQTRLDDWPWRAPDGTYLIRDLCGDLFRLPPAERLDRKSQRWLWAYVG
ncbi:MAG: hypothetical protein RL685_2784 [Pseudomonadota bacterium]|jgi:hypothetical protein